MKLFLVMLGGCVGAVARYGAGLLTAWLWGSAFPWGTLVVNLVGCLLIGLAFGLAERTAWVSPAVRLFFVTGFLGALTTFSSFAYETIVKATGGEAYLAIVNIVANNVGGLALVLAGIWLAKCLSG